MKIWSPLLATALVLACVSAQNQQAFDGDISVDILDENWTDDGVTEVTDACNGFPQYRKIPINQAFYLGTNNLKGDIQAMLHDGIRYLNINLCQEQGQAVVCDSKRTFSDVLESLFQFSRDKVEQFLVLNIKSNTIDTKQLEQLIDEKCKIHTEATAGTDEFKEKECPFVEVYVPGKGRWPSMGEVVNYNPEMAQWVGDGELVGVRTKFLITLDSIVPQVPGYKSAYFSPKFWRSINSVGSVEEFKKGTSGLCRVPAGGIGLEAYANNEQLNEKLKDIHFLEEVFTSRSGCNLNDSPLNTFFSFVSVDSYDDNKAYLKELEKRMMDLNFEKWSGNYKPIAPSSLLTSSDDKHVARDEL